MGDIMDKLKKNLMTAIIISLTLMSASPIHAADEGINAVPDNRTKIEKTTIISDEVVEENLSDSSLSLKKSEVSISEFNNISDELRLLINQWFDNNPVLSDELFQILKSHQNGNFELALQQYETFLNEVQHDEDDLISLLKQLATENIRLTDYAAQESETLLNETDDSEKEEDIVSTELDSNDSADDRLTNVSATEANPESQDSEVEETKETVVHQKQTRDNLSLVIDAHTVESENISLMSTYLPIPATGYYFVASGDTLSKIANRFGIPLANIISWNKIENANIIRVGQRLILDPTKITEKNFRDTQEFIEFFAPTMVKIANQKGLYPSIMIAQAIHESNSGNSSLSMAPHYNLFGIKGSYNGKSTQKLTWEEINGKDIQIYANFRSYNSYLESITDYANLLNNRRYTSTWTVNAKNYIVAANALYEAGYATDSSYARKIINTIETYKLYNYDPNLNGWHVINGRERYYRNDVFHTGLQRVDQTMYLFTSDGSKQYGWHRLNGADYYFNPDNGGMWTGKREIGSTTYLFNSKGQKEYGWHRLNGKDYYFDPTNGGMWTGKRKVGTTIYLFDNSGVKQYGWHSDGKDKYFFNTINGGMLTGLRQINGSYYFFNSENGEAVRNKTLIINGQQWRFNSIGAGTKI